jgi:N-glycosidase YbiA
MMPAKDVDSQVATTAPILFYSHHQDRPYWWCSNFADFPVYYKRRVWRHSEAPFQWEKFNGTDPKHGEAIKQALTPHQAAALGRDRTHPLRQDWDKPVTFELDAQLAELWQQFVGVPMLTKDWAMLEVVRCKFKQHSELQDWLLETGYLMLIEHTEKDRYWADNGDGSGKNMLGKILMIVREEIRRKRAARKAKRR